MPNIFLYSRCGLCTEGLITNTNVISYRGEKRKPLHLESKLYAKKVFWVGKVTLSTEVKTGVYRRNKRLLEHLLTNNLWP